MLKVAEVDGKKFIPVVLGGDINAYGVIRSFYEAYGVKSAVVHRKELSFSNPCNHSKLIQHRVQEDDIQDTRVFLKQINEIAKLVDEDTTLILVPCADDYTELVSQNRHEFGENCVFATVDHELFLDLCNKDSFYETCEKLGTPYPKTAVVSEKDNDIEGKLNFPVVVKAANPVKYAKTQYRGVKKIYVAENKQEYESILKEIYASIYDEDLIIQEYLKGDDSYEAEVHAYSDQSGKVKFMQFNNIVLELPTPGGLGSYGTIITGKNMDVLNEAKNFLEKHNYTGFSNFDLKYDENDGKYKFFEINLRLSRSSFTMTAAGYNLARQLVDDLLFNKSKDLEIADNEILYSIIPYKTALKYCKNESQITKMKQLKQSGKIYGSFWDPNDRSILRKAAYMRDQYAWAKNFDTYFHTRRSI